MAKKSKKTEAEETVDVQELDPTDEGAAPDVEVPPAVDAGDIGPTRYLKCILTEAEKLELVQRLEDNFATIEATDKELTIAADKVKSLKSKVSDLETENRLIARTKRDGHEFREVPIVEQRNERLSQIETVRQDTGEIVEARAMTAIERQVRLFDDGAPAAKSSRKTSNGAAASSGSAS